MSLIFNNSTLVSNTFLFDNQSLLLIVYSSSELVKFGIMVLLCNQSDQDSLLKQPFGV